MNETYTISVGILLKKWEGKDYVLRYNLKGNVKKPVRVKWDNRKRRKGCTLTGRKWHTHKTNMKY